MTTLAWMFWGYLAGFLLVAAWVARIAWRLAALERRLRQLGSSSRD